MSCIPWLSPAFTCITQNNIGTLSHALVYSFIVSKYVNLILRKNILGRLGLYFGGFVAELILWILGAKAN